MLGTGMRMNRPQADASLAATSDVWKGGRWQAVRAVGMTHHPAGVILIGPLMWIMVIAAMMIFHQAGVNP